MTKENCFNLGGVDIFTASNDQVATPVHYVEIPFAVEIA
jgi:hypothetical protein